MTGGTIVGLFVQPIGADSGSFRSIAPESSSKAKIVSECSMQIVMCSWFSILVHLIRFTICACFSFAHVRLTLFSGPTQLGVSHQNALVVQSVRAVWQSPDSAVGPAKFRVTLTTGAGGSGSTLVFLATFPALSAGEQTVLPSNNYACHRVFLFQILPWLHLASTDLFPPIFPRLYLPVARRIFSQCRSNTNLSR